MLKKTHLNARAGFSILQAMIAFGLIAIAVIVFSQLTISQRFFEARLDRALVAERLLAGIALQVQNQAYEDVVGTCGDITGAVKNPLSCVTGSALTATPAAPAIPLTGIPLQQRVTAQGEPKADGEMCVEIKSCKETASGSILEVTLVGSWENPGMSGAAKQLTQKEVFFRKLR